jgi:hypothetical protein
MIVAYSWYSPDNFPEVLKKTTRNRITVAPAKSRTDQSQHISVERYRKQTIPTEGPPHVGEVSANFFG